MPERKAPARRPRGAAAPPEPPDQPPPAPLTTTPDADQNGKVATPVAEPHPTGYVGDLPDLTPNEHYTIAGVIAGLPVPDHDR
jgi:hypothetical protein